MLAGRTRKTGTTNLNNPAHHVERKRATCKQPTKKQTQTSGHTCKKTNNETIHENIIDEALGHNAFENKDQGSLQATTENQETKENAQTQQTKKSDETKRHVMKALSQNEALIVEIMIQKEGQIRRNELEKQTKLAKSSLASSLYNLEKRNIVIVDKTNVVHFVKFTEWFNNL